MESVTQIEEHMRRILGPVAQEVARQTGFVRRERQVSGSMFAQGLIFGWMHTPDARMEQLCQALGRAHCSITAPGLSQRFTAEAVDFLQAMVQAMVHLAVQVEPPERSLLSRFSAVIVEDSTQISLPDKLRERWRGCGNGTKRKQAGRKLACAMGFALWTALGASAHRWEACGPALTITAGP